MQIEVIRTNGQREEVDVARRFAFRRIEELIGARTLDSVNLRDGRVMFVDDHGWETETVEHAPGHFEMVPTKARKPVNATATQLYHAICRPGTTHQIAGDVAIVKDADFEN
jgi:hypothetical protein